MSNKFECNPIPAWTYTDGDGDVVEVESGVSPAARDRGEDVFVRTSAEEGAYANARELIKAIAESSGLEVWFEAPAKVGSVQVKVTEDPKPEDPWLEVVPRSRAALVTEEFVRDMRWRGGNVIRPRFHERTGESLGVEYGRDDVKQIPIGDYVILEPGGVVTSIWEGHFNEHYRKVQA